MKKLNYTKTQNLSIYTFGHEVTKKDDTPSGN